MASLLEILNKSTQFLQDKSVPEARYDAECLLAHGLGLERMQLYLNFDRPLQETEVKALRTLVLRRAQREPLQHIIGRTGFRNLYLKSDHRALIPRPDTEGIVDIALALLKEIGEPQVLEIGTGTGAIALSLLEECPKVQLTATDLKREALTLAYENAQELEVQSKIKWIHCDLFTKIENQYDLIISNPPYISAAVVSDLEPEVKNFDPNSALVGGGEDGLDLIRKLLAEAPTFLKEGGHVLIEHGYDQGELLKEIKCDLKHIKCFKDYGEQDRFSLWKKN